MNRACALRPHAPHGKRINAAVTADLHLHSTASDGEWEPEAIVEAASGAGLSTVALTDHDTLRGVEQAMLHGVRCGIEVIPGCELTTYHRDIELHMLAYFVSLSADAPIARFLIQARERRRARIGEMTSKLRAAGIPIEDEAVRLQAGKADAVGLPHIAKVLVAAGHAKSTAHAIVKYLLQGCLAYAPKFRISPEEAVHVIHASGGLAVLAHPGASPHDELIAPLFRAGLDGIEAHHPAHGSGNRRFYEGLARRYEKLVTGGSDFHGPDVRANVSVGSLGINADALRALKRMR